MDRQSAGIIRATVTRENRGGGFVFLGWVALARKVGRALGHLLTPMPDTL